MKQITVKLSVVLLLTLILPSDSFSAATGQQYIKVGLCYGSGAVTSYEVKSDGGLVIAKAGPAGFEEILALPACEKLNVKIESKNITARDGAGQVIYENFDNDICIIPYDGVLNINAGRYRGGLCFYQPGGGAMNVINYIELDEYLYGVLNSEMGYSSPAEALKAQAVTARSFAVCNAGKHAADGFDFCTGVHCQVYRGYSDEYPQTNGAVDETSGMVITYGGETVSGYYFKNSGGHTQAAGDVWSNSLPYLPGVKDEYSPEYAWTHSITFQEAGSMLQAAGYNIGKIQRAAITGRNSSGAVSSMEFTGTSGTCVLKKDSVRAVFGGTNIKSTMFSLGGSEIVLYVIGGDGKIEKRRLEDVYILSGGQTSKLSDYLNAGAAAGEKLEVITKEPIVFSGAGYGHGVGLPQDSAIAMAKQGFTYDEILKYFYVGIEIE